MAQLKLLAGLRAPAQTHDPRPPNPRTLPHAANPPRPPPTPRAASGAAAQRPSPGGNAVGPGGQLWISATPIDNARQLLIVIDPGARNAAVYHVDAAAGTLSLKSTRDISWDLLVGDFNAQEPKPAALRKMLEIGRDPAADGRPRP